MDEKTVNVRRSVAMKAAATLAASVEPDTLDTKVRVYDWLYAGNISEDWSVGTYVDRLPLAREHEEMDDRDDWTEWLDDHIAVVETEEDPHPPSRRW